LRLEQRRELFQVPVGEGGLLVVDEDAAVLDRGALLVPSRVEGVDGIVLLRGDIGPPVPRGDTNLLRNVVDAVDGASLVGADDDERLADAADTGIVDNDRLEGLPLPLDLGDVDALVLDNVVDELGLAEGSDDDGVAAAVAGLDLTLGLGAG